jgi:hypothetical protein
VREGGRAGGKGEGGRAARDRAGVRRECGRGEGGGSAGGREEGGREVGGRGEGGHRHHLTPPAPHHAISSSHIMLTSLCAIANIAGVGMLAGPSKGSSKASTNFRFTS